MKTSPDINQPFSAVGKQLSSEMKNLNTNEGFSEYRNGQVATAETKCQDHSEAGPITRPSKFLISRKLFL